MAIAAAPLIPPALKGLAVAGAWVLGGVATLFAAKKAADAVGEIAQTKTEEKKCSRNHAGRIQAQQSSAPVMLAPGAPWAQCDPPTTRQIVTLIDGVQRVVYTAYPRYRTGLARAYTRLVDFCYRRAAQGGLHTPPIIKVSCGFDDGIPRSGSTPSKQRLDIDVFKGSALIS